MENGLKSMNGDPFIWNFMRNGAENKDCSGKMVSHRPRSDETATMSGETRIHLETCKAKNGFCITQSAVKPPE